MTRLDSPWANIAPGRARRVDADHVADFFWGVGSAGDARLYLDFPRPDPSPRLPDLQGVAVTLVEQPNYRSRVMLRLADPSLVDIFQFLCEDIVASTRSAVDQSAAAHIALRRTWRWHYLLRGGRNRLLSEQEQKGLIGELRVLRELIGILGAGSAIESWRGPMGSPKDFEVGPHAIEAKARRGAATPFVSISSADQLDGSGVEGLLLHVVDLHTADQGHGFTITDEVSQLADEVRAVDEGLVLHLEDRLSAAGYLETDDYSGFRWLEGPARIFRVEDGFPRISSSGLPTGVSRVRYQVDLNALDDFETTWDEASRLLGAGQASAQ